MKKRWFILLLFILLAVPVFAQGEQVNPLADIDLKFSDWSVKLVWIGGILITLVVLLCLKFEKQLLHHHKMMAFIAIALPAVLITVFIAGSTIFVNAISSTKGPIHWHSDFEVYKCDQLLDPVDPTGFSNRIGTPKFHEHNEQRLHVEGTVIDPNEVDLGSFFDVIGGYLNGNGFGLPTNNGLVRAQNGELCNGQPGKTQVFLYEITNPDPTKNTGFIYRQRKLENPSSHI